MKAKNCELCNDESALFCQSDSAFLCWSCDAKVHEANFLVARHVRRTVCSKCKGFTGDRFSGVGFPPSPVFCRSCWPAEDIDSLSLSSSSACISSTESCTTPPKKIGSARSRMKRVLSSNSINNSNGEQAKSPVMFAGEVTSGTTTNNGNVRGKVAKLSRVPSKVDSKTEGIFVKWCSELGVGGDDVVRRATHALGVCSDELTVLPFRVCLAASLWSTLRVRRDRRFSTCQMLKRLEQISGSPAKLILAAESRLARFVKMRKPRVPHQPQPKEGSAECSANTSM